MNQNKALVAGTFLAGLILLCTAEGAFALILALMFGGASFGLSNKYGTNPVIAAPELITLAGEAASGMIPPRNMIHVPINILKTALGVEIKPLTEVEKLDTDGRWKEHLVLTNKLVVGKSGSGKTFYLLSDIAQFKRSHSDGKLAIIDIDYGSSHKGSDPNYWFDLPHEGLNKVVYTSVDEGLVALDIFYTELERRVAASRKRQKITKTPWFLVIDEEPAIILSLSDKKDGDMSEKEMFVSKILQILRRGRKQEIYCSIGSQTLAVAQTAIATDALAQFDQVLLGGSIKSKKYLNWLGVTGKESDDVLTRIDIYSRQYNRLALTREDEQVYIRAMPHINLDDYEVVVHEKDATDEWFEEVLTPQLEGQIFELNCQEKAPTIVQIAQVFGIKESRCRNDNPKFLKVREWWQTHGLGDAKTPQ